MSWMYLPVALEITCNNMERKEQNIQRRSGGSIDIHPGSESIYKNILKK